MTKKRTLREVNTEEGRIKKEQVNTTEKHKTMRLSGSVKANRKRDKRCGR